MRRVPLILALLIGVLFAPVATAQIIPAPVPTGAGTVRNVVDVPFRCTQPLLSYATAGLPLIINHTTTRAASVEWNTNGAVRLETGCVGDGNPGTIDLVLHINGNGSTMGSAGDGLVLAGGDDIVIGPGPGDRYSWIECGGGGAQGGHEDAFRANRGTDLTMYRIRTGDWATRRATCHGAGGNMYMDNVNADAAGSQRVVCIECLVVASKGWYDPAAGDFGTGLGLGWSTDSGAIDSCFMAVRPIIAYTAAPSVRPVNVRNLPVTFQSGTNTVIAGDPAACPLLADAPPEPPPPSDADRLAACRNKLVRINNVFHSTLLNRVQKLSRIHGIVHETGLCAGFAP